MIASLKTTNIFTNSCNCILFKCKVELNNNKPLSDISFVNRIKLNKKQPFSVFIAGSFVCGPQTLTAFVFRK
jgi:hypothetical protein